jgi:hypothetical protein
MSTINMYSCHSLNLQLKYNTHYQNLINNPIRYSTKIEMEVDLKTAYHTSFVNLMSMSVTNHITDTTSYHLLSI